MTIFPISYSCRELSNCSREFEFRGQAEFLVALATSLPGTGLFPPFFQGIRGFICEAALLTKVSETLGRSHLHLLRMNSFCHPEAVFWGK